MNILQIIGRILLIQFNHIIFFDIMKYLLKNQYVLIIFRKKCYAVIDILQLLLLLSLSLLLLLLL